MEHKFEVVFDKEKETDIQKVKRWIKKQKPPFNVIFEYLFSFIEKWYWEGKVLQTMQEVDTQTEQIKKQWEEEEHDRNAPEFVETGIFGEEGWSISLSNKSVDRGTEEPKSSMGTSGNEVRLPEKLPDPWDDPLM